MEPTTTSPRTMQLSMTLTCQVVATLALARGGSSCSRYATSCGADRHHCRQPSQPLSSGGSYHFSSKVRAVFESEETIASFTTDDKGSVPNLFASRALQHFEEGLKESCWTLWPFRGRCSCRPGEEGWMKMLHW